MFRISKAILLAISSEALNVRSAALSKHYWSHRAWLDDEDQLRSPKRRKLTGTVGDATRLLPSVARVLRCGMGRARFESPAVTIGG